MDNLKSYFVAASFAAEIARAATRADTMLGRDGDELTKADAQASKYLINTADALGFVAIPKEQYLALLSFVEEVRDFKPTLIDGRAPDPQDDVDDMMPIGEFYAFQTDAEALVGRKAKKVAA